MIDIKELVAILKQVNIPVAYSHFNVTSSNPMPKPPFMVYLEEDSDNFHADNKVLKRYINYRIEVYTDKKDLALEDKIEGLFDDNKVNYETDELWIKSEKLFQRNYNITIKK